MKKLKVVVIGAGSTSFGPGIITDLITSKELKERNLTVALVDVNKASLDRMYRFANLVKKYYGTKTKIEATTDRKNVLLGAKYVITAVSQKREQLWDQDFSVPLAFGFRQVLGECGGPGAAFHTLRSLHLMIPICKDMEKLCPDALLINFTNPESRVCLGVNKLTRIHSVGLCHGAFGTLEKVAQILGKREEDIDMDIGGINHFHWVLKIHDKGNRQDLYPLFRQRMKKSDWGLDSLTRHMFEIFDLFPFPAASHIGEYISFAYEMCGPIYLDEIKSTFKEGKISGYFVSKNSLIKKIEQIVKGKESVEKFIHPTKELTIPIICDIEFNRKRKELSVNIPNENGAISNLPIDAIVEIPAQVDTSGIHPIKVGPLPEAIAAMCRRQISIQKLLVEAYQERSKKLLLQALLIDPIVDNMERAKSMMEKLLKKQADFLPSFR